jgi:cysteine synthase B
MPKIFDKAKVDQVESVSQGDAEHMARRLAAEEGFFAVFQRRVPVKLH